MLVTLGVNRKVLGNSWVGCAGAMQISPSLLSCKSKIFIFLLQDYLAHIIDTGDLSIKPEQVCALFGNIEDIYEFNR